MSDSSGTSWSREPVVEAIFVTHAAAAPMRAVDEATAVPGRGLAGDRYDLGIGTYSQKPGPDRHLTLIDGEALAALRAEGWDLAPGEHRRNLVVRGADLPALVGQEFRIGAVAVRGVRPCPPCGHLERVTGRTGLRAALEGRSGLRVEIVGAGQIRVGDRLTIADAQVQADTDVDADAAAVTVPLPVSHGT